MKTHRDTENFCESDCSLMWRV